MTTPLGDVFADTVFWVALVVRADQYHARAQVWSQRVTGRIVTTDAVLTETANTLARPDWRSQAVALIDHLLGRADVEVVRAGADLWGRAWDLYRRRPDKGWGLTDCLSFVVMADIGLTDALTADDHFRQAGFRAVLLEEPS
ncbi:type II toxin-antitoxin system VapC family toxin [Urbifossiella limnaea]|uniref:Ribonuclease VapC n=1 Tax=Urbifossiella limnaea TaxID=2528023 RepID=A0A517XVV6_9BACT|nr:PIN domain-containing protein [Urbifossiella limnaea]QDU21626.1 Ribonuclease VapC20 [Urbifossiella limnaea]